MARGPLRWNERPTVETTCTGAHMTDNRKQSEVTIRRQADGRYRASVYGLVVIASGKERAAELALELAARGGRLTTPPTTGGDYVAGRV